MSETMSINNVRLLGRMLCAEVARRGGSVLIPHSAIPPLLKSGWACEVKKADREIWFTLKEPDDKDRSLKAYGHVSLYRMDILLKYFISTATHGQLIFTDNDVQKSTGELSIESVPQGIRAHTTPIRNGVVHVITKTQIKNVDLSIPEPPIKN